MLELEVLILELVTVDGLSTSTYRKVSPHRSNVSRNLLTITLSEVTALNHEVLDNTVEGRALVAEALLASSESAEVLGGLGHRLAVQPDDDASQWLIAMSDVKVDLLML